MFLANKQKLEFASNHSVSQSVIHIIRTFRCTCRISYASRIDCGRFGVCYADYWFWMVIYSIILFEFYSCFAFFCLSIVHFWKYNSILYFQFGRFSMECFTSSFSLKISFFPHDSMFQCIQQVTRDYTFLLEESSIHDYFFYYMWILSNHHHNFNSKISTLFPANISKKSRQTMRYFGSIFLSVWINIVPAIYAPCSYFWTCSLFSSM